MTSKTFGYRRVSTATQSYERQTAALHGAGIPELDIFEDKMSGAIKSRPGLDALLAQVREGDTIVVSSLDRLGRSTLNILNAIDALEKRGVEVKSLKPGEDFEGNTGKLMRVFMSAVAEWERENIRERAAEARAARHAEGLPTGRKRTAVTPENVVEVRKLRDKGVTIALIARATGMSRASVYRALDNSRAA